MSSADHTEILSPCIGVCTISETTGLCLGCHRTIEEIRGWWDMSPEQQRQIMDVLEARLLEHVNFD